MVRGKVAIGKFLSSGIGIRVRRVAMSGRCIERISTILSEYFGARAAVLRDRHQTQTNRYGASFDLSRGLRRSFPLWYAHGSRS